MAAAPARAWRVRVVAALLLLTALGAGIALRDWQANPLGDRLIEREFAGLGTQIRVSLLLDAAATHESGERALGDVEDLFAEIGHDAATTGDGALGQVNAALASGEAAPLPDALRPLFDLGARTAAQSGGAYDPRIGLLVRLWGFDDPAHRRSGPPPDAEVQQLSADLQASPPLAEGLDHYGPANAVQLDFGALVRGWAVDRALALLHERGIDNALIDAGGARRAIGTRGAHRWRIDIAAPRESQTKANRGGLALLELGTGEAIASCGDDEHWFESGGRRYHHVLDPHSGEPAQGLRAATVVDVGAATASAAAAALMVAGAEGWREMAQRMGVGQALVVDARGRVLATPELAKRLQVMAGVRVREVP